LAQCFSCSIFFEGRCCWAALRGRAMQENYFVTYTHQMERAGNLEIAVRTVNGFPRTAMLYRSAMEFENMAKAGDFRVSTRRRHDEREHIVYRLPLRKPFLVLSREHWITRADPTEKHQSADKSRLKSPRRAHDFWAQRPSEKNARGRTHDSLSTSR